MNAPPRPRLAAALVSAVVIVGISRHDISGGAVWLVALAVVALTVGLTWAIPIAQRALPAGWVPGLLIGVSAATFACVPETNAVRWLAVGPIVMCAIELWRDTSLPFPWIYGASVAVLASGVIGAFGRESALVGAVFAWWPVMLTPALARFVPRLRRPRLVATMLVLFPAVAVTGVVARTGAIEPTVGPAVRSVAIAIPTSLAATAVVLILVVRPRPR